MMIFRRSFDKYYRVNSVNYDEYLEYNCTEPACQWAQYCAIVKQRYDDFEQCFNSGVNGPEQESKSLLEAVFASVQSILASILKKED